MPRVTLCRPVCRGWSFLKKSQLEEVTLPRAPAGGTPWGSCPHAATNGIADPSRLR